MAKIISPEYAICIRQALEDYSVDQSREHAIALAQACFDIYSVAASDDLMADSARRIQAVLSPELSELSADDFTSSVKSILDPVLEDLALASADDYMTAIANALDPVFEDVNVSAALCTALAGILQAMSQADDLRMNQAFHALNYIHAMLSNRDHLTEKQQASYNAYFVSKKAMRTALASFEHDLADLRKLLIDTSNLDADLGTFRQALQDFLVLSTSDQVRQVPALQKTVADLGSKVLITMEDMPEKQTLMLALQRVICAVLQLAERCKLITAQQFIAGSSLFHTSRVTLEAAVTEQLFELAEKIQENFVDKTDPKRTLASD